jgi:hypothetical protein
MVRRILRWVLIAVAALVLLVVALLLLKFLLVATGIEPSE